MLVMPTLDSAHIVSRLMQQTGSATSLGPILLGLSHAAEIVQMRSNVNDVVNAAALAAHESIRLAGERPAGARPAKRKRSKRAVSVV